MSDALDEGAQRWRVRWLEAVLRHHALVLIGAVVLTAILGAQASRIEVDTELRAMLPEAGALERTFAAVEDNYSAIHSLHLIVEGGDAPARRAFADAWAAELDGHPDLALVDAKVDSEFFVERALYYLSPEDFETLETRIDAWMHFELCSRAPDLCTLEPEPDALPRLRSFVEDEREQAAAALGTGEYYEREGIEALVVFTNPVRPPGDLAFSKGLVEDLQRRSDALLERPGAAWAGAELRVVLAGSYVTRVQEHAIVTQDMLLAGLIGLLGVGVILYLVFRSFRALLTLTLPLVAGIVWSMGVTQLLLGHLNTMTSLMSSVLMGLGIDAGIHLLARIRDERGRGHDERESIRRAFTALMAPLFVASTTTIGAFSVMATSSNPAFHELGVVGATGVALCLLAMITVYPALLLAVGVERPRPRWFAAKESSGGLLGRALVARPGLSLAALVVVTLVAVPGVQHMRAHGFQTNTRELQSDTRRTTTERHARLVTSIFGKNAHPGLLPVPNYAELERVYAHAQAAHADRLAAGDSQVSELVAMPAVMPDTDIDMAERAEAIASLGERFDDRTWKRLGERVREEGGLSQTQIADLQAMLGADPFTVADLPTGVLRRLQGSDGSFAILAYPANDPNDILASLAFVNETKAYGADPQGYVYAGEAAVPARMYELVRDEWPRIVGLAGALVFCIVWWQVRSLPLAALTVLPLVVGTWWLLGWMGSAGVQFNLVNVPILPAVLGIAVDNGVYLMVAIARRGSTVEGLRQSIDETARPILAATATTLCGFASFLVADAGGLRSIGLLAVLGIAVAAAAALTVPPTIMALVLRLRSPPS